MHVPDGFLDPVVALTTGGLSVAGIGAALRSTRRTMADRQIPLAGMSAAFIFAAQMVNVPIAAGTSGHLIGGALAAVLLGPTLGFLVLSVVVIVQAFTFADGGLTALGINLVNMGLVTTFGGFAAFSLLRRLLPKSGSGVAAAAGLAGLVSVPLSAAAFSIEWLFGAQAPVPFDTVFGAMVGVHTLIGIGEGILTALVVGAVLRTRSDLVFGARHLSAAQRSTHRAINARVAALAAVVVSVLLATVVSQFASSAPDGLERVAQDTGFASSADAHPLDGGWFADYATVGIDNPNTSLAVAGASGLLITLTVIGGMLAALRSPGTDPITETPRRGPPDEIDLREPATNPPTPTTPPTTVRRRD